MMTRIVSTTTNIIVFIVVIFGIYIIINGHLTPGGGFQGGAILATGFALLIVTYGSKIIIRRKGLFSFLESFGLILFIILAFAGIGTAFFNNFLAFPIPYGPNPGYLITGGVIPLMNIAVGIEVLAALTVILILMAKTSEQK